MLHELLHAGWPSAIVFGIVIVCLTILKGMRMTIDEDKRHGD